jgi:hypothetical protein
VGVVGVAVVLIAELVSLANDWASFLSHLL